MEEVEEEEEGEEETDFWWRKEGRGRSKEDDGVSHGDGREIGEREEEEEEGEGVFMRFFVRFFCCNCGRISFHSFLCVGLRLTCRSER